MVEERVQRQHARRTCKQSAATIAKCSATNRCGTSAVHLNDQRMTFWSRCTTFALLQPAIVLAHEAIRQPAPGFASSGRRRVHAVLMASKAATTDQYHLASNHFAGRFFHHATTKTCSRRAEIVARSVFADACKRSRAGWNSSRMILKCSWRWSG